MATGVARGQLGRRARFDAGGPGDCKSPGGSAEGSALCKTSPDHLGSQAITAHANGGKKAEVRYKAWGEDRYTSGTTPTRYRVVGKYYPSASPSSSANPSNPSA